MSGFLPGQMTIKGVTLECPQVEGASLYFLRKADFGVGIPISYGGGLAGKDNPGEGWFAIAATGNESGFSIYWLNTSSNQFARWQLDPGGVCIVSEYLPSESFVAVSTTGSLTLGFNQLGYALREGNGAVIQITQNGQGVSVPTHPSWCGTPFRPESNALAAVRNGAGFDLYWQTAFGLPYARWQLDGSGSLLASEFLTRGQFFQEESRLQLDLDGDQAIGLTFTPIRTTENTSLGYNQLGFALKKPAGDILQIRRNSDAIGNRYGWNWVGDYLDSPYQPNGYFEGAGNFLPIAARANDAGHEIYLRTHHDPIFTIAVFPGPAIPLTANRYARWQLDHSGVLIAEESLTTPQFFGEETRLQLDLDGDQAIGLVYQPSHTVGGVSFGENQLGYALQDGNRAPVQITYNNAWVRRDLYTYFDEPIFSTGLWRGLAAVAKGSGYDLYWSNDNKYFEGEMNSGAAPYGRWHLTSSGAFTSGEVLSRQRFLAEETRLQADLDRDGVTGLPYTPYRSFGPISLGRNELGLVLRDGNNGPVQIKFHNAFVDDDYLGNFQESEERYSVKFWTVTNATSFRYPDASTGYELTWQNFTNGQSGRWWLDSSGAFLSGGVESVG